jgi:hypothetical protein
MKSILYIVLVLLASLVATSVDAAPDPPAVNPHILDVKIAGLREFPNAFNMQRLSCASPCLAPHLPFRRVELTEMVTPNRPSDEISLAGHAADPSPPTSL